MHTITIKIWEKDDHEDEGEISIEGWSYIKRDYQEKVFAELRKRQVYRNPKE